LKGKICNHSPGFQHSLAAQRKTLFAFDYVAFIQNCEFVPNCEFAVWPL
jgi:hypothetical protein